MFDAEYELFPENNFNERTLAHEIQQGMSWVVTAGDALAGYALCRSDGLLIDIMRLGVREKFRRQGVASTLLKKAISSAPEAMLTVRKGNDPAIRLYKKHGFVIAGTMPQDYAWVMRRLRKTSS